ncbi:Peptidase M48 [Cinara cedri]|uniref:Metalloendopeptidase OMA1, mitochondrial n=1 Tax=Cinara cedri TaxID=506608 RepID=A0A5E4M0U7_9HEMI|nr:Peptidase M48 [Cinara cedri]
MFRRGLTKLCSLRTVSFRLPDRKYKSLANTCQKLVNTDFKPVCANQYQSPVVLKNGSCLESKRYFRVSPVNKLPLTKIITLVLHPVTKILAIFLGIYIRQWWLKLSTEEKRKFWHDVHNYRKQITAAIASCIGLITLYYATHIEIDPITGKRRLVLFSEKQIIELANAIADDLLNEHQHTVFPPSHQYYRRALYIAIQIINANTAYDHINDRKWFLIIVNNPELNAMVLPNGLIMVYSGLLDMANDAEIGIVLSHEMAHCLLNHHAMFLSLKRLLETLWLLPVVLLWAVFPIPDAILGYLLSYFLKDITILLPYERNQEIEADKYGLMLAANACIDIQQAPQLWKKFEKMNPINHKEVWWLSTHPSNQTRIKYIEDLLPYALELKKQQNCPD